ncbi:MAG TPA: hypothetical protein VK851_15685 [Anaerolineales bacterium]|nr:hypothetical protein [Anaerolineales bacterium]
MNDVRKVIYGTIIGFFLMLGLWFSIVYISSCGFTFTCNRADFAVDRTPIPTLIPVSHSESDVEGDMGAMEDAECLVDAIDLIGAWVSTGASETEAFTFTDINDQTCEGSFTKDIQPLLVDNGVWQPASLGCVSCHNAELSNRSAGLDLSSYLAIIQSDVLGNNWESSDLHRYLSMGLTPDGHSEEMSAGSPLVLAGTQSEVEDEATPTPTP